MTAHERLTMKIDGMKKQLEQTIAQVHALNGAIAFAEQELKDLASEMEDAKPVPSTV